MHKSFFFTCIHVYMYTCIHVYMLTRFSQNYDCKNYFQWWLWISRIFIFMTLHQYLMRTEQYLAPYAVRLFPEQHFVRPVKSFLKGTFLYLAHWCSKIPKHTNANLLQKELKISLDPFPLALLMMRECPCSTKTGEGLENSSPPPSRFPLAMGFAPLDPQDFPRAPPSWNPSGLGVQNPWPREISQDFPRTSTLGSREILGVGDGFSNPSLLLVEHRYIFQYIYLYWI